MKNWFKQSLSLKNICMCVMESKQRDIFRAGLRGDIVYAWQTTPPKTGLFFF